MSETDVSEAVGKTRWRRFALALAPAYAAVAGILILAATGTLAVSFAVSGTAMKISVDTIATGKADTNNVALYQFGVPAFTGAGAAQPTFETVIPNATLTNLCQSIKTPLPPPLPSITLFTRAGSSTPATATNLIVDATSLNATTATFTNINIGQDIGTYSNPAVTAPSLASGRGTGPNVPTPNVPLGTFGQVAGGATISGAHQVALGQQATSLTLPGLSISIATDGSECF